MHRAAAQKCNTFPLITPHLCGSQILLRFLWFLLLFAAAQGVLQPEALPVGFEDMHPVSQPVEQGAGQPLGAEHFRPRLKGQIGCNNQAGALIPAAC